MSVLVRGLAIDLWGLYLLLMNFFDDFEVLPDLDSRLTKTSQL